jgi:thiol:disulfide interchange protein DsbD
MRKASLIMRALVVATMLLVVFLLPGCSEQFVSTEQISKLVAEGNFSFAILVASVAGFLTALSPCVYPIIPITLSVIGARRYESALHGFLVSLSYVAGMVTLYVGLGVLFSSLGMLFGTVFRHPVVLIGVAILFIFFALSMFGVLNWLRPNSVMTRLSNFGGSGFKGAFLMGLVSHYRARRRE